MRRTIALAVVLVASACAGPVASSPSGSPRSTATLPSPSTAQTTSPPPTGTPVPTAVALAERPLVWFAPLPSLPTGPGREYTGSDDFLDLFATDSPWPRAAERIGVFKLYGEWVDYTDAASLRAAVTGIANRDIALAVEAGPLDATTLCGQGVEGFAGRDSGRRLASTIRAAGGTLQVIALDEPWYFAHVYDGPNACHWPVERVAEGVASFVEAVREEFPWVVVGDIEPNPSPVTADGLAEWLDAYVAAIGEPPAFLHLDVDWSLPDWPGRALAVESAARARRVPFGIIYNGGQATSDAAWSFRTGARILAYEDAGGGRPDHVVFQSWMDNPDHVLPESDAATFTALVDRYFDDRAALDDPPPGTEVNLALSRPVKASAELPDGPASAAVDGDGDTSWNAGAGPPAWIQIDLGVPVAVGRIVLTVAQSPNGQTIHIVSGRVGDGESNLALGGLAGNTTDNQRLVVEVAPSMPPLRYLRIDTTTSPSWVAWREIEVIPRAP